MLPTRFVTGYGFGIHSGQLLGRFCGLLAREYGISRLVGWKNSIKHLKSRQNRCLKGSL
jgi:hypothetical protein